MLSGLMMAAGKYLIFVLSGWMHLNREVLAGIKNFEQQREALAVRAIAKDLGANAGFDVKYGLTKEGEPG